MASTKYSNHFSLKNLPFGVASSDKHPHPQCATRLHNTVIFLGDLQRSGVFAQISDLPEGVFDSPTLNSYAALPKPTHRAVRQTLQSILQDGTAALVPSSTEDITAVTLHLPVTVPGFTDFSCSLDHVKNAGRAILNDESPPPGFFHFPIGYTGRASTIVVSGTPIVRPLGHFYDRTAATEKKPVVYGPSRAMDYELEIGVVVGKPLPPNRGLDARDAEEHIFGLVILNDWSARDIQGCEMVPLGPLNGKAFGSTISPWIVTLDALEPFKVAGPAPRVDLPRHLQDPGEFNYAIEMTVELQHGENTSRLSRSQAQEMFWSGRQMCAHLASTGCDLRTGDILGTGTVSGSQEGSYGCLLEITQGGKAAAQLVDGSTRVYLQDGDVVRMTAVAGDESSGVGFGECVGELRPARAL
ncbi:hypothetical protein HFD88_010456 [Aspergillus terreus]|nr:hypothetical protein HFD88_010456 [Aspergillus terreus]